MKNHEAALLRIDDAADAADGKGNADAAAHVSQRVALLRMAGQAGVLDLQRSQIAETRRTASADY